MNNITTLKINEELSRLIATDEQLQAVLAQFKDNPEAIARILEEVTNDLTNQLNPFRWQPVTPEEYLNNPYFCGINPDTGVGVAGTMFETLKKDFCEAHRLDANYLEVIATGCIDVNSLIQETDGGLPTLEERIDKNRDVLVLKHGIESSKTLNTRYSGMKECYEVVLANGMKITLTPEHKVQVFDKKHVWREAQDLSLDTFVVIPGHIKTIPSQNASPELSRFIGYVVTNGSFDKYRMRFVSEYKAIVDDFQHCVQTLGFHGRVQKATDRNMWEFHSENFVRSGFRNFVYSIFGERKQVLVHEQVCKSSNESVANFIRAAMSCEGCAYISKDTPPRLIISNVSERLIRQMQLLLLRFGISSKVKHLRQFDKRVQVERYVWTLTISSKNNLETFFTKIGLLIGKEEKCRRIQEHLQGRIGNTNVLVMPFKGKTLAKYSQEHGIVDSKVILWRSMELMSGNISRQAFWKFTNEIQGTLLGEKLSRMFHPDIGYSRIVSIQKIPTPLMTGDIGALNGNRFIANGIGVHNSIGCGKSYFIEVGLTWQLYYLSCLRNPQQYFKLAPGSNISLVVLSLTEKQAKKNVFASVKEMLKVIPYFRENFFYNEKKDTDSLIFPNGVEFFLGNSSIASTIGLNVYSAAVDEANFFKIIERSKRGRGSEDGTYNEVLELYNSLRGRQDSRFRKEGRKPGILYVGSSRMYPDDFTEQRIKKAKEANTGETYVLDYNLWTVCRDRYSKEEFKVEVGDLTKRSRILDGTETDVTGQVLNIPIDFKKRFESDLDNSIRNLAGVAVYSVQPFIGQPEYISDMFDDSLPRIFSTDVATLSPLTMYQAKEKILGHCKAYPDRVRYFGIDIGLKKDRTGIAMGYIEDLKSISREFWDDETQSIRTIKERLPVVVIEMILQVVPESSFGEVELARIRLLMYQLRQLGYKIKYASADGFQSADMQQQLRRKGINFGYISMDKTPEPYETFRTALYDHRIRSIYHPILERELRQLERDMRTGRIDHPSTAGGSKDIADAVGQMVHNAHINVSFLDNSLIGFSSASVSDKMRKDESIEDITASLNDWVRKQKSVGKSESSAKKEIIIK